MDLYTFPDRLRGLVQQELDKGERILWAEQPLPRTSFPWPALIPMLFAIPWTGFAIFWITGAAGLWDGGKPEPQRLVFALFGIPFVLVGIGMFCSPWLVRRRIRRAAERTAYVITDRRAIVFDGGYYGDNGVFGMMGGLARVFGRGTNIRSYGGSELGQIQRTQRDDGSGDVLFGELILPVSGHAHPGIQAHPQAGLRSGFFSIEDVRNAEKLLLELASASDAAN